MSDYVKSKKKMNFKSIESLQPVANVINEADLALKEKSRTIKDSAISEVLTGALGAGIGAVISFAALYGLGWTGLSAVGITSALATAGTIVGGGMVAGVFVLAAPIAGLAGLGVGLANRKKMKQLKEEKQRTYIEAVKKQNAIARALNDEVEASKERIDYLTSLNVLLKQAIKDLSQDLGNDFCSNPVMK